ncbi:MAG: hypothetical protein ACPHRO_08890, partial [Nannocystaceae bacterium]
MKFDRIRIVVSAGCALLLSACTPASGESAATTTDSTGGKTPAASEAGEIRVEVATVRKSRPTVSLVR